MTYSIKEINNNRNTNGGGLSTDVTGRYTSNRYEIAKLQGKLTAGEAAKMLNKYLKPKEKIYAKHFQLFATEKHHAGFFKDKYGNSQMNWVYFISDEKIEYIKNNIDTILESYKKAQNDEKEKIAKLGVGKLFRKLQQKIVG